MPRRNNTRRRNRRPDRDTREQPPMTTNQMAYELVQRGLATTAILGPRRHPIDIKENDQ